MADLLSLPGLTAPPTPGERRDEDYYPTPRGVVRQFVPHLKPYLAWARLDVGSSEPPLVLEPAIGDGRLAQVLVEEGLTDFEHVHGVDIRPEAVAESRAHGFGRVECADFFSWRAPHRYDLVITNPPFSMAQQFLDRMFDAVDRQRQRGVVVALLRLAFLATATRQRWMRRVGVPDVWVLPKRPKFVPGANGRMSSGTYDYAWFVWGLHGPLGVDTHGEVHLLEGAA